MAQGISNDQVQIELNKMIAFIKQEALEKAKEIHIKADEDFQIEKAGLVNKEIDYIDKEFEEKIKSLRIQKQISTSKTTNKSRLEMLHAQEQSLVDLYDQTRQKVAVLIADKNKYVGLLKDLILQGLLIIMEKDFVVQVRKIDLDIAKEAAITAQIEYKKKLGYNATVEIDNSNFLPLECNGGVFVTAMNGKISVNNTIEERLLVLSVDALPLIQTSLFGPNPNRKFYK